jgi:SSS family solute:Na+ symporter
MKTIPILLSLAIFCTGCSVENTRVNPNRMLNAYLGTAPVLDGVILPGEYDDATSFSGVRDWIAAFNPVTNDSDLSVNGWIKHDGSSIYLALDITDDCLYSIDILRWLPDENPNAHNLVPHIDWPWFGDMVEVLFYPQHEFLDKPLLHAAGDGSCSQLIFNLTKSRLGGVDVGGLIEHGPNLPDSVVKNYNQWITSCAVQTVGAIKPDHKGYVVEWKIRFNPCIEIEPGVYWTAEWGMKKIGFNISIGDLDEKERGAGNFGNFNHEHWWAGKKEKKTAYKLWGTLALFPGPKPK